VPSDKPDNNKTTTKNVAKVMATLFHQQNSFVCGVRVYLFIQETI